MKKNLLALFLVLLACALASQWPALANRKLRLEMADGLEQLWKQPGQMVDLRSSPGGVDAEVQVVLPPDCSERQQQWNFPLLRFISQRYGEPRLERINLSRRDSGASIPELNSVHPSQDPLEASNQAHLELIRRQAQAWLDQKLGADHGLALVDGSAQIQAQPLDPGEERHYLMARPEEATAGKAYRMRSSEETEAPITVTRFSTKLVLVLDGRVAQAEKLRTEDLGASLGLGSQDIRLLRLP
ncbi:hypothetical protein JST97_18510 [bacterium]|nr:hypothetical protein [bacterium]